MKNHTPPANAKKLTIYGKTVALWVEEIFEGNLGIKCVYEDNATWHYLAMPDYYDDSLDTKDKTDDFFYQAITQINQAIDENLKPKDGGDEPKNGSERIEWLINRLTSESNTICINK